MPETVGTLNLKIARLKNHLDLLEKQQQLSRDYPHHQNKLIQGDARVRFQLHQLIQYRKNFRHKSLVLDLAASGEIPRYNSIKNSKKYY